MCERNPPVGPFPYGAVSLWFGLAERFNRSRNHGVVSRIHAFSLGYRYQAHAGTGLVASDSPQLVWIFAGELHRV